METTVQGSGFKVPLKYMKYRVPGDLIILYPKPYSIYFRGTIFLHKLGIA